MSSQEITHHWVIMGVSGSGKSSVGLQLATMLRTPFIDADDLHSPESIEKMRQGTALTDSDRSRWLESVGSLLLTTTEPSIVACSALKKGYRDRLREFDARLGFIYLKGSPQLVGERLKNRNQHFMPLSLLDSQFETLEPLEPDEYGFDVDIDKTVINVAIEILRTLSK